MTTPSEFKVTFGRIGRTLVYEDEEGSLLFCFEAAPTEEPEKKKWTIFLEKKALSGDAKALLPMSPRVEIAGERAREYLLTLGYEVVVETA